MPALFNSEYILSFIDDRLKKFINEVRFRSSDEVILIYVYRGKIAEKVRPGFTSLRQMNNLASRLSQQLSLEVDVIFTIKGDHQGLEDALYQMLKHKFPDAVVSFYMSLADEITVNSWVEISGLTEEIKNKVEDYCSTIFQEADLNLGVIEWIDSVDDLPALPLLLKYLKTNQPIKIEYFEQVLRGDFPAVSKGWLNQKLDQCRRKNLIIREKEGIYCLSAKGLSIVPAGAWYTSSDIDRVLALGRKKW